MAVALDVEGHDVNRGIITGPFLLDGEICQGAKSDQHGGVAILLRGHHRCDVRLRSMCRLVTMGPASENLHSNRHWLSSRTKEVSGRTLRCRPQKAVPGDD